MLATLSSVSTMNDEQLQDIYRRVNEPRKTSEDREMLLGKHGARSITTANQLLDDWRVQGLPWSI